MKSYYNVVFENEKLVVECDAERDKDGNVEFSNFLVTDKETNKSSEALELPDGIMALMRAVDSAVLEED